MNIQRFRLLPLAGLAGLALFIAACSSGTKSASSTNTTAVGPAGVTISTASVPGFGSVLVNGSGRSLYILSSEKGGKVTCTDANGCTKAWPPTELPSGVGAATAGSGVQASMLGTVKGQDGSLYVTYAGYPLYTFVGDSGPGQAKGQHITNFGGTWYLMAPGGSPLTSSASATTTSPGSGGYGY
jgi:predicted lipoprotein with Yx(FWY)xxD motif